MSTFTKGKVKKRISDENKMMELELRKQGFNKPFKFSTSYTNSLFIEFIKEFNRIHGDSENIKGEEYKINSIVDMGHYYSVIKSPSFTINVMNSYLRVTINKKGGLHLSRLQVDEHLRGKGLGSILLGIFTNLTFTATSNLVISGELKKVPIIDLEVTSSVGLKGVNQVNVNIDKSVSLYEKFGFRVVESKREYRRMVLDFEAGIEKLLEIYEENKLNN